MDGVRQRYNTLSQTTAPNEAVTEQELIHPVLELLGWADYLPQQGAAGNEDIPDLLLFADAGSKTRAAARSNANERYRDAVVVEESKRFRLPLDTRDASSSNRSRTPHGQILRYLSTAETVSENRIRWGILTNGGVWRLYDYRARPRATAYFEADLGKMLESGDEDGLRLFYLLFRRDSVTPQQGATTSFLETALAEGRRYEEKVAKDLSSVVFERVFPKLVEALASASGAELSDVRHGALIFPLSRCRWLSTPKTCKDGVGRAAGDGEGADVAGVGALVSRGRGLRWGVVGHSLMGTRESSTIQGCPLGDDAASVSIIAQPSSRREQRPL